VTVDKDVILGDAEPTLLYKTEKPERKTAKKVATES
jgi:hypothetical protein